MEGSAPGSRSFPTFTLTHLERCEDRAFISARSALCPAQADALAQRSMSSRDIVIAVDCDEIHDALLAELRDRGFVSRIADIVLMMKLRRKIIDEHLIVLHAGRTLALGPLRLSRQGRL